MKTQYIDDVFVLSFPKAGRTWLRVLFAKLLQMGGGNPKKLELIRYRHDGSDAIDYKRPKTEWSDKRIILLIRDPRDVIVSFYFQIILREKHKWKYKATMSEFIRSDKFGIKNIVDFYNCWDVNSHVPKRFMIVQYEDLRAQTLNGLQKMIDFMGLADEIKDIDLNKVIEYSSFDNMKQMDLGEKEHLLSNTGALKTKTNNNEELKVRRGIIGGYKDYLTDEDIKYVNEQTKRLKSHYGYEVV